MRPKTKIFPVKFRRILEVLRLQGLQKIFGRTFKICVSKNEDVCHEVQMHFGSSPLTRFTKKFWAYFQDLCVQKRRCLPWSSDAF